MSLYTYANIFKGGYAPMIHGVSFNLFFIIFGVRLSPKLVKIFHTPMIQEVQKEILCSFHNILFFIIKKIPPPLKIYSQNTYIYYNIL